MISGGKIVSSEAIPVRPDFDEIPLRLQIISLAEVRTGRRLYGFNKVHGRGFEYRILAPPYQDSSRGWWVEVEMWLEKDLSWLSPILRPRVLKASVSRDRISLADFNVVPYSGGGWNSVNCLVDP